MIWVMSVLTMVVGNLVALRPDQHHAHARLLRRRAGGVHVGAPSRCTAPAASPRWRCRRSYAYLLIYMVMNIGAFAVVMAVARKTGSADLTALRRPAPVQAPGLAFAMTIFLFSLAGIPPLAGWYAKFGISRCWRRPVRGGATSLAIIVGVNSVIALFLLRPGGQGHVDGARPRRRPDPGQGPRPRSGRC